MSHFENLYVSHFENFYVYNKVIGCICLFLTVANTVFFITNCTFHNLTFIQRLRNKVSLLILPIRTIHKSLTLRNQIPEVSRRILLLPIGLLHLSSKYVNTAGIYFSNIVHARRSCKIRLFIHLVIIRYF